MNNIDWVLLTQSIFYVKDINRDIASIISNVTPNSLSTSTKVHTVKPSRNICVPLRCLLGSSPISSNVIL